MRPPDRLRRRFRHHAWAGRALADAVAETPDPSALRLLAHALAADRVWHRRLVGAPVDTEVWPSLDADGCRALWAATTADWDAYLASEPDLGAMAAYQNTRGVAFETAVADVLDHVLLHGAHHRGQASAALRAAGAAPPALDFIAWARSAAGVRDLADPEP